MKELIKQASKLKDKNNRLFFVIVICLAIGGLLRVFYCLKYPVPVRDSFSYKFFIEEWVKYGKLPYGKDFPPLGLYLLHIPSALTGCETIKSSIIMNVLFGMLFICVSVYISKCIFSSTFVQCVIGLIVATHPTLIDYSCQGTRENSYLLFCCLSIFFIIKYM